MEGYKLLNRMEDITWEPPVLSFSIERHGGTVLGSTRAELHRWSVNLERMSAELSQAGFRQLYPMEPRLKVEPIADDLVRRVLAGQRDERLKWLEGGDRVRILIGKIIPGNSAAKETVAGRRRRLAGAIDLRLSAAGWTKMPGRAAHTYEKGASR